jgi:hypothetical protein
MKEKEEKKRTKEINRERWCTNQQWTRQALREKEKKEKRKEKKCHIQEQWSFSISSSGVTPSASSSGVDI